MGRIVYFYLEVFNHSTEYSHSNGIKQIYLDSNGTQMCFIDDKHDVYVYDPINESVIPVPDCPDSVEGIVWDQNIFERFVFIVYNKTTIITYVFVKYHVDGEYSPFFKHKHQAKQNLDYPNKLCLSVVHINNNSDNPNLITEKQIVLITYLKEI